MSITGHPDGPPAKSGVPVADIGCSLFALYGILGAYIGRQKTGRGQHIDAALFEAGIAFAIWDISEFWGTGRIPQRIGTGNRMAAPYQAVRARDGYFVLGANNDRLWVRLLTAIARTELADRPEYKTNADRLANREALVVELETTFLTADREHWVDALLEAGIPAGPINDYAEALSNPHAVARQTVMEIDHPVEGRVRNIGFPIKLSDTPQQVRRPPPRLGEHTAEVLAEIGFTMPAEPVG